MYCCYYPKGDAGIVPPSSAPKEEHKEPSRSGRKKHRRKKSRLEKPARSNPPPETLKPVAADPAPSKQRKSKKRSSSAGPVVHQYSESISLKEVRNLLSSNLDVKKHRIARRSFKKSFEAADAIAELLTSKIARDTREAIAIGNQLVRNRIIMNCQNPHFAFEFLDPKKSGLSQSDIVITRKSLCTDVPVPEIDLGRCMVAIKANIDFQNIRKGFHVEYNVFCGSDVKNALVREGIVFSEREAIELGNRLLNEGFIEHIQDRRLFVCSDSDFYRNK